jgi:hypothetical protein
MNSRVVDALAAQLCQLRKDNSALRQRLGLPACRPSHKRVHNKSIGSSPKGKGVSFWKGISAAAVENAFDPWAKHGIDKCAIELVIRHRYNFASDSWQSDESVVKMLPQQFDEGAQRACYRMKKMSQVKHLGFSNAFNWKKASNYVAKHYKDESMGNREAYFDDIKLQCSSQYWADRYNKHLAELKAEHQTGFHTHSKRSVLQHAFSSSMHSPPLMPSPPLTPSPPLIPSPLIPSLLIPALRSLPLPSFSAHSCYSFATSMIFINAFVIEFVNRPGSPLFGAERFIAGEYIKHNSNASFVDRTQNRMTPQTFSHFTFHASEGKCMVVDMQVQ